MSDSSSPTDAPAAATPAPSAQGGATPGGLRGHPLRVAVVIGLVTVAAFLVIVIAATTKTDDVTGRVAGKGELASRPGLGPEAGDTRPLEVESVSPGPSDVVGPQPEIVADLVAGYTGEFVIDGIEIPADQTTRVPGLGTVSFRPGAGKEIPRFDAGVHSVRIVYWPDTGTRARDGQTFNWSFRSAA